MGSNGQLFKWNAKTTTCPACKEPTIKLQHVKIANETKRILATFHAYPPNTFHPPTPKEVPEHIKEGITRKHVGSCLAARKPQPFCPVVASKRSCKDRDTQQMNLANQIDALLNESDPTKVIPKALRQTVDVNIVRVTVEARHHYEQRQPVTIG